MVTTVPRCTLEPGSALWACTVPFALPSTTQFNPAADSIWRAKSALLPVTSGTSVWLPENTHLASEGKDIKIDQVVIGSCTNGRLEDMEAAYNVLKGKHIAKGVRGIIIPATMAVYKECILRGWTTAFIDAGCIVSTPTCGPCLGGYMGILAEGERCVSTTNRNFVGRMGHVTSEIYLASPATAAASALTGHITDPREVEA